MIRLLCKISFFIAFYCTGFTQAGQTAQQVQEHIVTLEKADSKPELINIWKQVLELRKNLEHSLSKSAQAQSELSQIKRKLPQLKDLAFKLKVSGPKSTASLKDVAKKVEQLASEKTKASLEISNLNKLEQARASRTGQIPGQIRDAKTKLEELQTIEKPPADASAIDQADYQRKLATRDFYQQLIKELILEQTVIEQGAPVLKAEKLLAEKKSVYYSEMLGLWKGRLSELEARETASDKERMTKQLAQLEAVPELKAIAVENLKLLDLLEDLRSSSKLENSTRRLKDINTELSELKSNWLYAQQRIKQLEGAGLSVDKETGQLLRQQATSLTSDKLLTNETKRVSGYYTQTQLDLLKLRNQLKTLPSNTEEFLNQLQKEMKLKSISMDDARQLIAEQKNILKELIVVNEKIAGNQNAQINALKETITTTKSYSQFINERLIWIPSADVFKISDFAHELKGIQKVFGPEYFAQWFVKIKTDILDRPFLWGLALLILGFLVFKYKSFRSSACDYHKQARRRNCQTFKPTFKGALIEVMTALPGPFILGFLSWRSIGFPVILESLVVGTVFSFLAGVALQYSRSDGFIVSNFKLNERQCKIIHRTMTWFLPMMLPLLMLFIALSHIPSADSYGRVLYIITMVLTMLAFLELFRPKHQLINKSNAECRVAKVIFVICMIVPTALIVAVFLGYYSSAIILRNQFISSVWLVVISVFSASLFSRWFLVSSRKIAIRQALERREALIKEREKQKEKDPEAQVVTKSEDEVKAEAVNLAGVKEQTAKLVKVALICSLVFGLVGIWGKSLPALSILDKQTLWELSDPSENQSSTNSTSANPITNLVSSPNHSGESGPLPNSGVNNDRVSLQDLLFSIIIFVLTYISARNIPGLLQIAVLDNINIKSGAAFALTTTVRYLIVLFGIIWAFGNVGVTWSSIQWIAAAVTLGIGFGLQEVFANFVAGLILLYERPIRLGDVVTVGDVSGRVTEIKIRATTVLQFNNHELIVPNKEFITGQLVNWTLRDNIIRAEVMVGVAYGSDTKLAEKLLLDVANAHPKVLSKPKADVLFEAFGASSLDFRLRAYVAGYDDLLATQSDLHYRVNEVFADAGIEIAFPQQDIHIKSVTGSVSMS